jgi:hypothetical protein
VSYLSDSAADNQGTNAPRFFVLSLFSTKIPRLKIDLNIKESIRPRARGTSEMPRYTAIYHVIPSACA